MSNAVKGKNAIAEILVEGEYYPIFCAKSFEFEQTQDEVEVTSVNSGTAREYIVGMETGTLSCAGVTITDNTGGQISAFYFMSSIRRYTQSFRLRFVNDDGNSIAVVFSGIITRNGISKDTNSYSQSSVNIRISGDISTGSVAAPDSSTDNVGYGTFVQASGYIQDASLIGVTLIGVWQEGSNLDSLGISYSYNSGLGRITPDAAYAIDGQKYFVIWVY